MAAATPSAAAGLATSYTTAEAEPPILETEVVAEEAERSRPQPVRQLLTWIGTWDTRSPEHIQSRHRPAILAALSGVFRLLDRLAPGGEVFALLRVLGRILIVLSILAGPIGVLLGLLVTASSALYSIAHNLFWALAYFAGILVLLMIFGLARKPRR